MCNSNGVTFSPQVSAEPALSLEISNDKFGIIGYLVVDTLVSGTSLGGIRILPDVTYEEIRALARNMTLKFAFIGLPMGGAKSGIVMKQSYSAREKEEILRSFGKKLSSSIKSHIYVPGFDMGSSLNELNLIFEGAGADIDLAKARNISHTYTAWSMFTCAKELLRIKDRDISGCSIAIEGFGKVGSEAAKIFSEHGARVVAVSNLNGCICGRLDVDELASLREKFGDDFIGRYDRRFLIPKEKIFSLPVDILLLCARPWPINSSNLNEIKAGLICSGANLALTADVEEALNKKGIAVLPDFVSNCGGVLGSILESNFGENEIFNFISKEIGNKIRVILDSSYQSGITISRFARVYTDKRLLEIRGQGERDLMQRSFNYAMKRAPYLKKFYSDYTMRRMVRGTA